MHLEEAHARFERNEVFFSMIDSHIHLDLYKTDDRAIILRSLRNNLVQAVIAVSFHLASCRSNLEYAKAWPKIVFPAFGHHPEQEVPGDAERQRLIDWMASHRGDMIAVGEVGLPYYKRTETEAMGGTWDQLPYLEWLETFVRLARAWDKPLALHAVYEDAEAVCDLLERHNIRRAHFHWFKGSRKVMNRMMRNGYRVSLTPDVGYDAETREVAAYYPIELLMTETDGPWPFEGRHRGRLTCPAMMRDSIRSLADLKGLSLEETADMVYRNALDFYDLPISK